MTWLAPQWIFLFIFAFVPILIHLWKKSSAKKIVLSSLYLLHRKDPNFHKNLKLHQFLLLMTRILLVILVVSYFLKTISLGPLGILSEIFPFHQKTKVYLDTAWDSKKELIDTFSKKFPSIQSPNFEQILLADLDSKVLNPDQATYFLSRFYGSPIKKLESYASRGLRLVAIGPDQLKNTRLNSIRLEPKNPFVGEFVEISSSILSNQAGKSHLIQLEVEGQKAQTRNLKNTNSGKRDFSFKIKAQGDSLLHGKIKLQKDEYLEDNEIKFKIPLRRRLKIALIEDVIAVQEKKSKLHYIYQFLSSIQQNSPQFNIDFQVMTSSQFNSSQLEDFDWLILGELQNKVWKKKKEKMIVFAQRGQIQDFYNEKFSLKTFNWDQNVKTMEFLQLPAVDRALISSDFKSYGHLQMKMSQGQALIKANHEVLAMSYLGDYFFSFSFNKTDFSGVLHPYFPVYLYRLLLDRWELDSKSALNPKFEFSREADFFKETSLNVKLTSRSDFSIPILILLLCLVLLELYLVLSIEKQKI
ncbi:BatA domain-containing protein [bacterium]|nr:BatA domain-containing protein [bacterium]